MIAVIFHWELPIPLQERFAAKKMFGRISHTCKAFGIKDIILVNVDNLNCGYRDAEINLTVVSNLEEALALVNDSTLVFVEEGGKPLSSFEHPENATYVFGSDFGELERVDVGFKTNNPLHAEVALGVVLYDRSLTWPLP